MSVTFRAILNNGISVDHRKEFPTCLAHTSEQISPRLRKLGCNSDRLKAARWKWAWNSDVDSDFESWLAQPYIEICFDEPPIVALGFNSKTCVINLSVSWISFTTNPDIQEDVRSVIQCFGRSLFADSAIYVPDSGWRAAEKTVESIAEGAGFTSCLEIFISELQAKGSFSNLPRDVESDSQCKRVKSICSAWPAYFDHWNLIDSCQPTSDSQII